MSGESTLAPEMIQPELSVSNDRFDRNYLRLSVQRALVGSVSPALYGGCAALEGNQITLTWYVAPDLTEDEWDDLSAAGSMVIADFPDGFRIDERFVHVRDCDEPLKTLGDWVILQRGFRTIERW